MARKPIKKIAVIGTGSWATALVKILQSNDITVAWVVPRSDVAAYMIEHRRNPRYLKDVELNADKMIIYKSVDAAIKRSDACLLALPSAFFHDTFKSIDASVIRNTPFISAIKGIIPDTQTVVSEYLRLNYGVPLRNIAIISGPSHAEEIAMERKTYLTISSKSTILAKAVSKTLGLDYVYTHTSRDVIGVEYAAVLKNVYSIGIGIAHGLNYGDNFIAVLFSQAAKEMHRFVMKLNLRRRDFFSSAYMGDFAVTAYSQFSRNRTFGTMIGHGYSIQSAQNEMNMIAEGYYNAKAVYLVNMKLHAIMPFAKTVYDILYENKNPKEAFLKLEHEIY